MFLANNTVNNDNNNGDNNDENNNDNDNNNKGLDSHTTNSDECESWIYENVHTELLETLQADITKVRCTNLEKHGTYLSVQDFSRN
ncbi:unnamed protein product [Rotaria magnacalcarata]|uniref:Uncharacterized protein n=1 Tax=Rotaria magnacalcarata TaxID=392030 RepID=A0A819VTT0_9BILA|nr:unnamed protein product [Rotaria magnacalcarata]